MGVVGVDGRRYKIHVDRKQGVNRRKKGIVGKLANGMIMLVVSLLLHGQDATCL